MNQNLSPIESGCDASPDAVSIPNAVSPLKATYETPLLTEHGSLRNLTLSGGGGSNLGGDTGPI